MLQMLVADENVSLCFGRVKLNMLLSPF